MICTPTLVSWAPTHGTLHGQWLGSEMGHWVVTGGPFSHLCWPEWSGLFQCPARLAAVQMKVGRQGAGNHDEKVGRVVSSRVLGLISQGV